MAFNWHSLTALIEPGTRSVRRGAVDYHIDLAGRAVPVEITLPKWFLELASTNPEHVRRRAERCGSPEPRSAA